MHEGYGARVNQDASEIQPLGRGPYPGEQGPSLKLPFGLSESVLNTHTLGLIGEQIWLPFTRTYQGIRWPGAAGLVCFMGMSLYACAIPSPEPILVFILTWLGMLCGRKGMARENFKKGLLIESASNGVPLILMKLFRCGESMAKNIECLLTIAVSMALLEVYEPIGVLLMIGALCMCVTRMIEIATIHAHEVAMRDAMVRMKIAEQRMRDNSSY